MELISALGIDWHVLTAQLINYGILFVALSVLLYKPVLKLLDDRRERIAKSMEDAKKIDQKLKEIEKERESMMKQLDQKSSALLAEAKKQADGARVDMVAAAKSEAENMLERGRKQLEDERRKMVSDLEKTVARVGVELASRILQREFSAEDQKRIVSSFEKDLPSLIR
ncbi:MAG TPA: F0F1 ATP synthase subunit B [Candidatus Peribacterales bacterium]|nr:F0F1 ATP synthase subunit B [Candidatus Peribacterales bacterium]